MARTRWRAAGLAALALATLSGCGGRVEGVLEPVAATAPGASRVEMIVVTTRGRSANPGELYGGDRSPRLDFADIVVSIPPDAARKRGEVQWPRRLPADPSREFATLKAEVINAEEAEAWAERRLARQKGARVLVFVHGFNNRFDDAVYRFAQIVHDSDADVIPVLFTWPSRGNVLAYGYDRESTNYSRDALETVLAVAARNPGVAEVSVLAHSMGNWLAIEALRQMAIRDGRVAPKIRNLMLAAPDVDVDVFRTQMAGMGPERPNTTLFVSQDDRALAASRRVWGASRLGAIDPEAEPYRTQLAAEKVTVVDLTRLRAGDRLHHGKFAESPEVVRLIGARLAEGQVITDSRVGVGDRIVSATTGAASAVGTAAGLVVSAPVAIVDPNTRKNYGGQVEQLGQSISGAAESSADILCVPPRCVSQ